MLSLKNVVAYSQDDLAQEKLADTQEAEYASVVHPKSQLLKG